MQAAGRLTSGLRRFASDARVATQDQTHIALVLERLPVVMPPPEDWEVEHVRWQEEEVQPRNRCSLPEFWAHFDGGTGDASAGREWTPAPHVTPADTARDTKSLQRCLDQRLYFLVRLQGQEWGFPQRQHRVGESTRTAAERVLAEETQGQGKLLTYFMGHGPMGHTWHKDSATFFHRAQLIKGSLLLRSGSAQGSEFAWLNKAEALERMQTDALRHVMAGMLW